MMFLFSWREEKWLEILYRVCQASIPVLSHPRHLLPGLSYLYDAPCSIISNNIRKTGSTIVAICTRAFPGTQMEKLVRKFAYKLTFLVISHFSLSLSLPARDAFAPPRTTGELMHATLYTGIVRARI